jgi:hypothetical protein
MKPLFITIFLILVIILSSCREGLDKSKKIVSIPIEIKQQEFDSLTSGLNFKAKGEYLIVKKEFLSIRKSLKSKYNSQNKEKQLDFLLDSVSLVFTKKLLDNIIPFWYGTPWDFNGYTAKPNKGLIACGYFVSTTLNHTGLNINRYKLAQQNPENEAKSIAIKTQNLKIIDTNNQNINTYLKTLKDGLYFVGLDSHVGYLYIHKKQSYFIHSNYIVGYVMVELTDNSEAFGSQNYYITPISANKEFLLAWLNSEKIIVNI